MLNLTIFLENYWESQSDELEYVNYEAHFSEKAPCNIYIIGSRPRVVIDEKYLKQSTDEIELLFKVQEGFNFKEIYGKVKLHRPIKGEVKIESEFPHSTFSIKDDNGFFVDPSYPDQKFKAFYALRVSNANCDRSLFSDFKALYIGKSLKMDKTVSAAVRLKSHKKLQMVATKCTTKYVDKEIYFILCSFVGKVDLRAMDTEIKALGTTEKLIEKIRTDNKALNPDIKMITQVAEAALIDYFNTKEFNSDFIGSFGRPTHLYFKPVIASKIDTISVEIDLNNLGRIYSDTIAPHKHHGIEYKPKEKFARRVFNHNIDEDKANHSQYQKC